MRNFLLKIVELLEITKVKKSRGDQPFRIFSDNDSGKKIIMNFEISYSIILSPEASFEEIGKLIEERWRDLTVIEKEMNIRDKEITRKQKKLLSLVNEINNLVEGI